MKNSRYFTSKTVIGALIVVMFIIVWQASWADKMKLNPVDDWLPKRAR